MFLMIGLILALILTKELETMQMNEPLERKQNDTTL